jgi:hypothetical protein
LGVHRGAYTTDTFYGLRWRWSYTSDGTGTPVYLASFCPHCDYEVAPEDTSGFRAMFAIMYNCYGCERPGGTFEESAGSLHNKVGRFIQQKLRNGTWVTPEAVSD